MAQRIILLADDDVDDTDMFCEALANVSNDVTCYCSTNGSELLKKLNELPEAPELIFLDLNMPVMNGWECLKVLKEEERYIHIPVIMISTSSHKKEIHMASEFGALCYFVKPYNFNEFTRILQVITANTGSGLKDALAQLQDSGCEYIFSFA